MSEYRKIDETTEEVLAEGQRRQWVAMDEDERDRYVRNVVYPAYMVETADGDRLGPTWWANYLGATYDTIQKRTERLRRAESDNGETSRAEPNSRVGRAAATLRDPDKAREVLSDPDARKAVREVAEEIVAEDTESVARVNSKWERSNPKPTTPKREPNISDAALALTEWEAAAAEVAIAAPKVVEAIREGFIEANVIEEATAKIEANVDLVRMADDSEITPEAIIGGAS